MDNSASLNIKQLERLQELGDRFAEELRQAVDRAETLKEFVYDLQGGRDGVAFEITSEWHLKLEDMLGNVDSFNARVEQDLEQAEGEAEEDQ